jgi:integrase
VGAKNACLSALSTTSLQWLHRLTSQDLWRTAATLAQSLRIQRDYVKALLNHKDQDVTLIYARWHMFEEKREAVLAIESAVLPLTT